MEENSDDKQRLNGRNLENTQNTDDKRRKKTSSTRCNRRLQYYTCTKQNLTDGVITTSRHPSNGPGGPLRIIDGKVTKVSLFNPRGQILLRQKTVVENLVTLSLLGVFLIPCNFIHPKMFGTE